MNERLLAVDEIVKKASKDKTYCQLSVDIGVWVAKKQDAQTLQAVRKWLVENSTSYVDKFGIQHLRIRNSQWQNLLYGKIEQALEI